MLLLLRAVWLKMRKNKRSLILFVELLTIISIILLYRNLNGVSIPSTIVQSVPEEKSCDPKFVEKSPAYQLLLISAFEYTSKVS